MTQQPLSRTTTTDSSAPMGNTTDQPDLYLLPDPTDGTADSSPAGTDFGIACGTPVHAALPGTVIAAGWDTAYGWRTVITHGVVNGVVLTTTYNHQSHLGVAVGDQVAEGQVIGLSGTTGFSTGCHLHFELYVNSTVVDSEPWLPPH